MKPVPFLPPFLRRRLFAPVVPVVRIHGPVGRVPLQRGMAGADQLEGALARAFALRRAPAVALSVDSPGGTPTRAWTLAARIRELAERHGKPVIAFVGDVAASGAYWVACAADEIVAAPTSIVGSIGVITAGFGFPALLERLGIERRVHARGRYKDFLDPFRPEDPEHVAVLEEIHADLLAEFVAFVRGRRGERLRLEEAELASGRVWTARRALELGLVDGLGHLHGELERRFGEEVRVWVVNPPRVPWFAPLRLRLEVATGDALAGLLARGPLA